MTRLVITCCAADASPVNVDVSSALPAPPTGAWVQVTGRYAGSAGDVPRLSASAVVAVPMPQNPYD